MFPGPDRGEYVAEKSPVSLDKVLSKEVRLLLTIRSVLLSRGLPMTPWMRGLQRKSRLNKNQYLIAYRNSRSITGLSSTPKSQPQQRRQPSASCRSEVAWTREHSSEWISIYPRSFEGS